MDWKKLHEEADKGTAVDNAQYPDDAVLYKQGLVLLNRRRDKEAGEVFARLSGAYPGLLEAKWGRAEVLRRQHRLNEAQGLLQEVIAADPRFAPAYISLAYVRYIQGNFNETVRLANKVLAQGARVDVGSRARAYLLLGGAKGLIAHYGGPLSKIINGTKVLSSLKAAEKLQPDAAAVKFGLGTFYLLAPALIGGNLTKAEEYLKKSVELDPLFVNGYVRLAQLYKMRGKAREFQSYLRKALEIDPQNEFALDTQSGRCFFICDRN